MYLMLKSYFMSSFLLLSSLPSNNIYTSSLQIFEQSLNNHTFSRNQAEHFPYSALQVDVNDDSSVIMVMGHILEKQQKWYSKDGYGFTTQGFRIVQCYVFDADISLIQKDPVWQMIDLTNVAYNQSVLVPITIDFLSRKRFGVHALLTIQGQNFEVRDVLGQKARLLKISEQVDIPSMNYHYTNYYWKDVKTGFIWESIQKWGPNAPKIHYKVVKPWVKVNYP